MINNLFVCWCREKVDIGNIIIRQRGKTYEPGHAVKLGRDYTIYAMSNGWVKFDYDKIKKKQTVSVSDINPHLPNMENQRIANLARQNLDPEIAKTVAKLSLI